MAGARDLRSVGTFWAIREMRVPLCTGLVPYPDFNTEHYPPYLSICLSKHLAEILLKI